MAGRADLAGMHHSHSGFDSAGFRIRADEEREFGRTDWSKFPYAAREYR